jgi:hypothetical protein
MGTVSGKLGRKLLQLSVQTSGKSDMKQVSAKIKGDQTHRTSIDDHTEVFFILMKDCTCDLSLKMVKRRGQDQYVYAWHHWPVCVAAGVSSTS